MSNDFANWYQAVTFGHDRGLQTLREEGAKEAAKNIDESVAIELVKLVFGGVCKPQDLDKFRQFFKDKDPSFRTSGNDEELRVLAGWVLAEISTTVISSPVTVAILTSALCGSRKPQLPVDLVGIAENEIKRDGDKVREAHPIAVPPAYDESLLDTFIEEHEEYPDDVTGTIKAIALEIFSKFEEKQEELVEAIRKNLEIQNEELQTLWWCIGQWSEVWNGAFVDLSSTARPLLLAHELAALCTLPTEPRSVKSIFSRVHVDSEKRTIPEAVMACGIEKIAKLAVGHTPCQILTPVHFAIMRANETGADESWITPWEKVTGISKDFSPSGLDLAVQYFRERKFLLCMKSD